MSALLASRITLDVCSCFTIDIYTFLLLFAIASECDSLTAAHSTHSIKWNFGSLSLSQIMTERSD